MLCVTSTEAVDLGTPVIGGKASNLAKLKASDFRVPDFVVLTTEALEDHVAQAPIQAAWKRYLAGQAADEALGQLIAETPITDPVRKALRNADLRLSQSILDGLVAVRSSAPVEDAASRSFAGQFVSVLGVRPDDLERAIRECWGSLVGARAACYLRQGSADEVLAGFAVIVQAQLVPEKAGVMYTVSPRPDGNSSCYIEANYGTGDTVVGGRVSPDGYECSRWTGEVTFRHIGRKSVMSTILEGGGTADVPVADQLRVEPVLGVEEISDLVRLGRDVEEAFGSPQDIEWAIDTSATWLLQSRPITGGPTGRGRAA